MPKKKKKSTSEEVALIARTQKLILRKVENIEKSLKHQRFLAYVRFFIIVIPILLGILLLVPAFQSISNTYRELLETLSNVGAVKPF